MGADGGDALWLLQMSMDKYDRRLDEFEGSIQQAMWNVDDGRCTLEMAGLRVVDEGCRSGFGGGARPELVALKDQLSSKANDDSLSEADLEGENGVSEIGTGLGDGDDVHVGVSCTIQPKSLRNIGGEQESENQEVQLQHHSVSAAEGMCSDGDILKVQVENEYRNREPCGVLSTDWDRSAEPGIDSEEHSASGVESMVDQREDEPNEIVLTSYLLEVTQKDNSSLAKEWEEFAEKQVVDCVANAKSGKLVCKDMSSFVV